MQLVRTDEVTGSPLVRHAGLVSFQKTCYRIHKELVAATGQRGVAGGLRWRRNVTSLIPVSRVRRWLTAITFHRSAGLVSRLVNRMICPMRRLIQMGSPLAEAANRPPNSAMPRTSPVVRMTILVAH